METNKVHPIIKDFKDLHLNDVEITDFQKLTKACYIQAMEEKEIESTLCFQYPAMLDPSSPL